MQECTPAGTFGLKVEEMRTLFHELELDPAKGLSTRPLISCSDTLEVASVPGGSFLTCIPLYSSAPR